VIVSFYFIIMAAKAIKLAVTSPYLDGHSSSNPYKYLQQHELAALSNNWMSLQSASSCLTILKAKLRLGCCSI